MGDIGSTSVSEIVEGASADLFAEMSAKRKRLGRRAQH
jgi:hypothetical protein